MYIVVRQNALPHSEITGRGSFWDDSRSLGILHKTMRTIGPRRGKLKLVKSSVGNALRRKAKILRECK